MPHKKARLDIEENRPGAVSSGSLNEPMVRESEENDTTDMRVHDNRLANFTNPLARSDSQKAKNVKPKPKLSKVQRSLVKLMDLPVDMFLEIAAHLEPIDILHLARVSKHFRSFFNPKTSRHVWITARRNIPTLPDCPSDLTEAQYASLMFEHTCQACGVKTVKVDYCLRLKFCTPCFRINISKGGTIAKAFQLGEIPLVVYTLLPRTTAKFIRYNDPYESSSNTFNHTYYAPELCLIFERYRALEHDKLALDRFVQQQQTLATQLMQSGRTLLDWDLSFKKMKGKEKRDLAHSRRESIEAKLFELGWDRGDFPSYWEEFYFEWTRLMNQPRELTPRIWSQISPKLVAILEQCKATKLEVARLLRVQTRKSEFILLWDEYLLSYTPEDGYLLPNSMDAVMLPRVSVALNEDGGNLTVTNERFTTILPGALIDSEDYKVKVRSDLLQSLQDSTIHRELYTTTDGENDTPAALGPLYQVSAIFSCSTCMELLTYPSLLSHSHIRKVRWQSASMFITPEADAQNLALQLLQILKLPTNILRSSNTFKSVDGRFLCNCGCPTANNPTDFITLLNHIFERRWYTNIQEIPINHKTFLHHRAQTVSGEFRTDGNVYGDHAIEDLASRLSLAHPSALQSTPTTSLGASTTSDSIVICIICHDLTGSMHDLTQERVTYHMNTKHHIYENVFDMVRTLTDLEGIFVESQK